MKSYYRVPGAVLAVEVETLPASVDWDDIRVEWAPDDLSFADCAEEGTSFEWLRYSPDYNQREAYDVFMCGRDWARIVIDEKVLRDSYRSYRANGYSRQAAAEAVASERRSRIDCGRNLAENGTSIVTATWGEFSSSCGGYEHDVKPENGRDEIENEQRAEVAREMQEAGIEIMGAPEWFTCPETVKRRRSTLADRSRYDRANLRGPFAAIRRHRNAAALAATLRKAN